MISTGERIARGVTSRFGVTGMTLWLSGDESNSDARAEGLAHSAQTMKAHPMEMTLAARSAAREVSPVLIRIAPRIAYRHYKL